VDSPFVISPTVGRFVNYWPSQIELDHTDLYFAPGDNKQPFAAQVVYVHSDRMVNLVVADHRGKQFVRTSVPLVQEGDERPELGSQFFCEWMQYQTAQAKKHAEE
jgi:hypothetical protein